MGLVKTAFEMMLPKPVGLALEKLTEPKEASSQKKDADGLLGSGAWAAGLYEADKMMGGSTTEAAMVAAAEFDHAHGRGGLLGVAEKATVYYEIGKRLGEFVAGKGALKDAFGMAAAGIAVLTELPKMFHGAEPEPAPT